MDNNLCQDGKSLYQTSDYKFNSKIKEFYTTKINHEIKNSLITLKYKFEQFQASHYKFYSLILKKNPELEMDNLRNYINILINKIFNICDFLSEPEHIKKESSKVFLKECLENVFTIVKNDFRNEDMENKITLKFNYKNLSQKEYIHNDERKLKQLLLNAYNLFRSFNILGSRIKTNVSVSDVHVKISIAFKGSGFTGVFDIQKLVNAFRAELISEEDILKEMFGKDMYQEVENNSTYYSILIKKLIKVLHFDLSVNYSENEIFLELLIPRNDECKETIHVPLSDQETLKLSLRELCFDKNKILKNSQHPEPSLNKFQIVTSKKEVLFPIRKKKSVKFSSIIRIREDLKNLAKKDKKVIESSTSLKFVNEEATFSHDETPIFKMKEFSNEPYPEEEKIDMDVGENSSTTKSKIKKNLPTKSFDNLNFVERRKNFKVLIVDDEKTQRQSLQRMLKSASIPKDYQLEVISACDGVEAIYKIMNDLDENGDRDPIRCIILDENMKYLNGSKTLEMLQNINYLKDYIKRAFVISLSSHYSVEFEEYMKKFGCHMSVTKPMEKGILNEILNRLVYEY